MQQTNKFLQLTILPFLLLFVFIFISVQYSHAENLTQEQKVRLQELRAKKNGDTPPRDLIAEKYQNDFFGLQPSERELVEHNKNANDSVESFAAVSETLETLGLMMRYESLQDGECKEAINVESSAQQGNAQDQWILADLYNKGLCVKQDKQEAFNWIKKSSEQNYKKALFDRGQYHFQGIGTPVDYKQALTWFEKAAGEEDVRAYRALSTMNLRGEGVIQNLKKSLEWAVKGAEAGDVFSQIIAAGIMYDPSNQSTYDPRDAYKWALIAKFSESVLEQTQREFLDELITASEKNLNPQDRNSFRKLAQHHIDKQNEKTVPPKEPATKKALPELAHGFSDKLTEQQALENLNKIGIGKDRYFFHQAIDADNLEVFKLFLKAGASIETIGPNSGYLDIRTPLYRAAEAGSKKIADHLIENGANLNAPANHDGDTPILVALSRGHYKIAERLLDAGADLSHEGIMHNAVESNAPVLLQKLYDKGLTDIDVERKHAQGSLGTPLKNAVWGTKGDNFNDRFCFEKSVKFLLDKGAKVNNSPDDFGNGTMLEKAITTQNPVECVRMLLQHGANPKKHSSEHYTMLFRAVMSGNAAVTALLVEYGVDPNELFTFDQKSLPWNMENKTSRSLLVNKGTPLMLAISENKLSVAKVLIENGANPYIKTTDGLSAVSIAKENNHKAVLDLITEYESKNPWKNWYQKIIESIN